MQRYFLSILAVLAAIWLVSLPVSTFAFGTASGLWPMRKTLILGTGFLAICCISIAMILAARPARLEKWLGGLDQFYRLHKRLGIAGALFGVAHWLLEIVPKWMVGQGWLTGPPRGGGGGGRGAGQGGELFGNWHDAAKEIGEWGLYLLLALVVVALWKRIPYRHFARLHRLLPVVYLLLVFHSVVFIPPAWWAAPAGPVAALLMMGGAVAAVLSLSRRIGFTPTERLIQAVPDYVDAEVWFCGPKAFGDAIRKGLIEQGLRANAFHQEAFEIR